MKSASLLTLYRYNIRNEIARSMQFRVDFAIGVFTSLLFSMLSVLLQFLVFRLTRGYPGWSIEEMVVFQGTFAVWTGIRHTLFGGVPDLIQRIIWRGDFDRVLLKPFHAGGFLLVSGFDFQNLGTIGAGVVILAIALPATGATVTATGLLAFLALLTAGIVLYLAVTLVFCALTVTAIFSGRLQELIGRLMDFSGYPSEIFPKAARVVYEIAVPFAVFICFPARALLGRLDLIMLLGAAVAVVLFFLSLLYWNHVEKRYTSGGG
jgi:ABC-2 type transport system permease protein